MKIIQLFGGGKGIENRPLSKSKSSHLLFGPFVPLTFPYFLFFIYFRLGSHHHLPFQWVLNSALILI